MKRIHPTGISAVAAALATTAPRQPIGHILKSHPKEFNDVIMGARDFEIRKDDRDFQCGDTVVLVEYDPTTKQHTGRNATREIGFVERGTCVPEGLCGFRLQHGAGDAYPMQQVSKAYRS